MAPRLHPFAAVQYARSSFAVSSENLPVWLRPNGRAEEVPPVPSLPQAMQTTNTPSLPLPPGLHHHPEPETPGESVYGSPGHFVKHSSKATLLLSGQEEGATIPVYTNGGTIEGILAVPHPSGLLNLEITVEGRIKLDEVAGSGTFESDILKDTVFAWDANRHASFPTKVTFRYTLPTHYAHQASGKRYRLPPTYEARLSGMPGFNVTISYAIVVSISRPRNKLNLWRGTSRLVVPFRYRELSRPLQAGPFPASLMKTSSGPKTLFQFHLEPRRSGRERVNVQLFLPTSQLCTLRESIPFSITLTAGESVLEPFSLYRPLPTSFHPISSTNSSASSLQQQLMDRTGNYTPPANLLLQRRTQVDSLAADMPELAQERTHILGVDTLAVGAVHTAARGPQSITWSGAISLPPSVQDSGFVASGIKVTDWLTLSIVPPDAILSDFMQFSKSVPVRLTTEAYDFYAAPVTVSEWP